MEAFDTNVIVRLLVRDDEEQCRRADALPLHTFDERLSRTEGTKLV